MESKTLLCVSFSLSTLVGKIYVKAKSYPFVVLFDEHIDTVSAIGLNGVVVGDGGIRPFP